MSFIFDGNKQNPMAARQYAMAMRPPTDIGSGIQSIAQALMARQQQAGPFPTAPEGNPVMQAFGRMGSIFGLGQRGLY